MPETVFKPALPAMVEDRMRLLAGTLPLMHFLSLDAASFHISAAALLLIARRRVLPAAPIGSTVGGSLRGCAPGMPSSISWCHW